MEFRYNYRNDDLFSLVARYLCDLVPKHDQSPILIRFPKFTVTLDIRYASL